MSATQTSSRENSTHSAPCGRSSRSRTSASHAGTNANVPARAADHGATRRGANTIQHSAAIHQIRAIVRKALRPSMVLVRTHAVGRSAATTATYIARAGDVRRRRNADHSHAPASTRPVSTTTVVQRGSHNTTTRSTAARTLAVAIRLRRDSFTGGVLSVRARQQPPFQHPPRRPHRRRQLERR